MESDDSYDYDKSEEEGFVDDDDADDVSFGEYGEEPDIDEAVDDSTGDSDDEGSDIETVVEEIIQKPKVMRKPKGKEQEVPNLEDLTEKILRSKRFNRLDKLQKLAEDYGLDIKEVLKAKRVRRKPKIEDYHNLLLGPQDFGYSSHGKPIVKGRDSVEDAGEDAEGTNIPLDDDEGINWVLDKKKHKWADNPIWKDHVKKGLVNKESLYFLEWTDARKARRPQKETVAEGASFSFTEYVADPRPYETPPVFGKSYTAAFLKRLDTWEMYPPVIPPQRTPKDPAKIIGDDPTYGKTVPLRLDSDPLAREPPPGYESFLIGERVSFLGEEVYKGFLTKADGPSFYISGVKEPFYYENIDGKIPIAIPSPEFSYVFSTQEEDFGQQLRVINEYWPEMANLYLDQELRETFGENGPNRPIIVGLVLNRGRYSWIYDFTMDPLKSDVKQFIPISWRKNHTNYNSITQYVSVAISGVVEGTVIGYVTDKVIIRTDQGVPVKIPLGDPSLRIIPGREDKKDPSIPTKKDILRSQVSPAMRLAVVDHLFNNFADVIPGLIEKDKENKEEEGDNIPLPFITVFRTWDEYFNDEFYKWLRAKYQPQIIKNLPFDKLKQEAHKRATMGLGEEDIGMFHNKWGLDLVNSLDENYRKRLVEWGIAGNNPVSFFLLSSDTMLMYLKDSKNKTVFEIEIERGLYNYQPYQPPRLSKGFKRVGGHSVKSAIEEEGIVDQEVSIDPKHVDVTQVGGYFVSTRETERQDPRVTETMEKKQLAVALTRMIRSFMIRFPLSEGKIYEELVDEEIDNQYNKLVPLSGEGSLTQSEGDEANIRLSRDLDEFSAMHAKNLLEIYVKYEAEWNEKLDNPEGKVEKIIVKQEIMRNYEDQLAALRAQEIELTQDPNDPGKMRPDYIHSFPPETKRLLNTIAGNREILKNDILMIKQDIQILGSAPRTESLSLKGHDVRSEIKQFERNCMVVSQEKDTVESYLKLVLKPLIFISRISNVSNYSESFRSKIANRTYPIDSLLNANLFYYFPEFCMKDNSEETKFRGGEAIEYVNEYITMKFVQNFIDAKYLGPRRIETRPEKIELGFDWQSATISPQKVCEEQTNSGKTLVRDGYKERYYKKEETKTVPVEGTSWLEQRIVTETEIPLYKTIEDGNLIIERNPETKKFICHSKPEIILHIAFALKANPYTEVILDPQTNYPYASDFIDRMRRRYQKEIDHAMKELPANFVLYPAPKSPKIVSDTIYDKVTKTKLTSEEEEEVIIESKPWRDLSSFQNYIRPKGKVLVLFCNKTPECNKFKEGAWSKLKTEYEQRGVIFLDIDVQGINYGGSDIALEYNKPMVAKGQLVMKVPSIFLFVNGDAMGRSAAKDVNIRNLIGEYEEMEESDDEEIEVVSYKEKTVKSTEEIEIESDEEEIESDDEEIESDEEEIDVPLWTDLNSFLEYISLGCVLVLICDTSHACTTFKSNVWSNLIRENPNIRFLDVSTQNATGLKIVDLVRSKNEKIKAPVVILFCNKKVRGHAPLTKKKVNELIAHIKKKNDKK